MAEEGVVQEREDVSDNDSNEEEGQPDSLEFLVEGDVQLTDAEREDLEGMLEEVAELGETDAENGTIKRFYEGLEKKGYSKLEIEKALKSFSMVEGRREYRHNFSLSGYLERVIRHYGGKLNLVNLYKGFSYLVQALGSMAPNRDPDEDIEKGASLIVIPGYLQVPKMDGVEAFEEDLGRKVVYLKDFDMDELHRLVSKMAEKGPVQVLGYSDGVKAIMEYISVHGEDKVDRFFCVAENDNKYHSPKVVNIIGDQDMLAILESSYTDWFKGEHENLHIVPKTGHTWFWYNKDSRKNLAKVVNSYGTPTAYNTKRGPTDPKLDPIRWN